MPPAVFSVCGNRMILRMEICEELRYNFDDRLTRKSGFGGDCYDGNDGCCDWNRCI